jgi:spore germination protein GerM
MRMIACAPAALLVFLTAACGVRAEDSPHALTATELPHSDRDSTVAVEAVPAVIYLWGDGDLTAVVRTLEGTSVEARVQSLLSLREKPPGTRTAIPAGTRLEGLAVRGDMATLHLSGRLLQLSQAELQLAVAQLLYTATEAAGITRVSVWAAGHPVAVSDRSGRRVDDPLARRDLLLPERKTAPREPSPSARGDAPTGV